MQSQTTSIDTFWVIRTIITMIVLIVGSYIHVKIVSVSYKVKDKTWQLDIAHSVSMIISISFVIIFETISDQVSVISEYTGTWLCYIASFVYTYGAYLGAFHSFCIALVKYLHIVHRNAVNSFGERKFKMIFVLVYILHPLFLTIPTVILLDFEGFPSLIACFGLRQQLEEKYNSSSGSIERMMFCKLNIEDKDEDLNSNFYYNLRQGFCASKVIWVLILSCNIPEGFLYLKIFRLARRYVFTTFLM